jgi:hypothetical protein
MVAARETFFPLSSRFLSLVERNIAPEIFFSFLLSDPDVSKLLCTGRVMKKMILKWRNVLPAQEIQIKKELTDKMLKNMIKHYSYKISKLKITISLLTMDGFHYVALLHSNLLDLSIDSCLKGALRVVSNSLVNLTSLTIINSSLVSG